MSEGVLPGIAVRSAAEAARHAALGGEARGMLSGDPPPGRYLDALTTRGLWPDAVRFLASALPKREAVWWAYLCALGAHGESPAEPVAAALEAVRRWVVDPDESNRRAAEAAAQSAGPGTPAGCAALAAFWSEGSLGPDSLGPSAVPPADRLTARAVASAVLLAAVMTEPERAPEKFRRSLALGLDVAARKNRWEDGTPKAPAPDRSPSQSARQEPPKSPRRRDTWE